MYGTLDSKAPDVKCQDCGRDDDKPRSALDAVALKEHLAVSGFAANSCFYNVDGGKRAVLFDTLCGGVQPDMRGEGTHFLIPVVQRPIIIDVRTFGPSRGRSPA